MLDVDNYQRNNNDSENTPFSTLQLSNINSQSESYSVLNKQDNKSSHGGTSRILKTLRDKPLIDILNITKSTIGPKCLRGSNKENDKLSSCNRSRSSVFRRLYQKANTHKGNVHVRILKLI